VSYDRVFALHTLRNMAHERKDAHITRIPALHAPDCPVADGGQSGLSPASEIEGFIQPDCSALYGGLSG
jgi:hypothetical protein